MRRLSDARTVWSIIDAGAAAFVFSTVGGVTGDVYEIRQCGEQEYRILGYRQVFHVWGSGSSDSDANTGSGGDPSSPPPPPDPCQKKGQLYYSPGVLKHITDRHIVQTPENVGASYYTFSSIFGGSVASKQRDVKALNQEAFEKGGAIPQFDGRIAYVYAPKGSIGAFGYTIEWGYIGADRDHQLEYTNVRTVIAAADYSTVITSYPGLPRFVSPSDPRIVGTPRWKAAINTGV